jgi:3-phosphoshikimate 1-carboxyvinyltransferase
MDIKKMITFAVLKINTMQVTVYPSSIKGIINAPASKSMTQRAVAAAALARGTSVIRRASDSDDARAALGIATTLGATVERDKDAITITGNFSAARDAVIQCEESGLCMRMFAPIAALLSEPVTITGKGSLLNRPTNMIAEALQQLNARCTANNHSDSLPVTVQGPLKGANITIDGYQTSQLLTGLIMALPLVQDNSEITVKNLSSKSYVDMTIQLLKQFGVVVRKESDSYYKIRGRQHYTPQTYVVEGDWSSAAFLLVAAALKGEVTVQNLFGNSKQPDSAILKVLTLAGADIMVNEQSVRVARVAVPLKAFQFDATDSPDLFPPLVVLAAYCRGVSVIYGINRLTIKESNRAVTLQEEFTKLGVKIELVDDAMRVHGGAMVRGGVELSSHHDHRIAMALATAALAAEMPVTINDTECVSKSYPDFFSDLKRLYKPQR